MTSLPESELTLHVQPNASQNRIVGFRDDVLWVKIAAPPADGKANLELVIFLSGVLGLRKSDVGIERGASGRHKVIKVRGLTHEQVMARMREAVAR
jgi:uncharacterized protein (TIGR00251 family)